MPQSRRIKARRGMTELVLYALAVVVTACVGIAVWQGYSGGDGGSRDISTTLRLAGLASFPTSTKSVKTYKDTVGSNSSYYLAADLNSQQIQSFLAHSPILAHASTAQFNIDHNYLSEPSFDVDIDSHRLGPSPHLYFSVPDDVRQHAAWFDPTITRDGSRYLYVNQGVSCEVDVNNYDGKLFVQVRE